MSLKYEPTSETLHIALTKQLDKISANAAPPGLERSKLTFDERCVFHRVEGGRVVVVYLSILVDI